MAKELNLTDEYGDVYPNAYFRPVQINLSPEDKTGNVVFYGFPDAAASNKSGRRRVIGQKSYAITASEYVQYFEANNVVDPKIVKTTDQIKTQAYKLATEKKDVDTGTKDGDGKPVFKSFFEGGIDV